MELTMEQIHSPRIKMNINGHRFVAAYRIDHPASNEPTEYAIYETDDGYFISISDGGVTKTGTLTGDVESDILDDAERAVDDFHSVDHDAWARRDTLLHI